MVYIQCKSPGIRKKNNQNLNEMSKCNWFLRYSQKFVMTNSVPYKSGKDYIQNHMQLFCRTFEFSMFHEKRKKKKTIWSNSHFIVDF